MDRSSYWQIRRLRDGSFPDGLHLPKHIRYLIIGGGILGLSTALHLKMSGVGSEEILVIEVGGVGAGASGKSGGILVAADDHFPGSEADLRYLKATLRSERIACRISSAGHALTHLPGEYNHDLIDPFRFAMALARRLRELGIRVAEGVEFLGLGEDGTHAITSRGEIGFGRCLVATGAHLSDEIARDIGLVRSYEDCMAVEVETGQIPWAFFFPIDEERYVWGRHLAANQLLIGGGNRPNPASESIERRYAVLSKLLAEYMPAAVIRTRLALWQGRLTQFADKGLWRFVKYPKSEDAIYGGGFGDCGLTAAFHAGSRGADILSGRLSL